MTNNQSDRLDMYQATIQFIEVDEPTISSMRPGLLTGKDQLKVVVANIVDKAGKQNTATGGAYDDKGVKKEELVQQLFLVTQGVKAWAGSMGNNTVQEQMNYSLSELRKLGDESISGFTANIVSIVTPLMDDTVADFGVDAAAMEILNDRKTSYDTDKSKGRSATTFVKASTEALPPLFTEASRIVKEVMDPVAATLKASQPDWYNRYKAAREILDTAHGTTSIEFVLKEEGTNAAIVEGTVEITGEGLPDVSVKTGITGHAKVKVKRGIKHVVAKHSDYVDKSLAPFEIKQGQELVIEVVMVRKP